MGGRAKEGEGEAGGGLGAFWEGRGRRRTGFSFFFLGGERGGEVGGESISSGR